MLYKFVGGDDDVLVEVFDKAVAMIQEGVRLGHHLMANMTVYKDTDVDEPHGEHLGNTIAAGDATAPIDPDVFLHVGDIGAITKALKVAGVRDASAEGLDRLLAEGVENALIPVVTIIAVTMPRVSAFSRTCRLSTSASSNNACLLGAAA